MSSTFGAYVRGRELGGSSDRSRASVCVYGRTVLNHNWAGEELIEQIRERSLGSYNRPVSGADYDGFWPYRLREYYQVRNHVIDPTSLLVDRCVRRTKTDRIDAVTQPCAVIGSETCQNCHYQIAVGSIFMFI